MSTEATAAGIQLHYHESSGYMREVVGNCSTLQTGYQPATLWGRNSHVQTVLFSALGRTSVPELPQQRFSVVALDGSTLHYDVFEPEISSTGNDAGEGSGGPMEEEDRFPYTVFICPGINNSSENSYVRGFAAHCLAIGYRVVVYNHLGALSNEPLTGRRIFTYGGTEDMSVVFKEVSQRYPRTLFMGCGFSVGACILVRFLGEKRERRSRFVFAASFCQGYDPFPYVDYMYDWKNMRRLYAFQIAKFHKKLISRHKHALFPPPSTEQQAPPTEGHALPIEHQPLLTAVDADAANLDGADSANKGAADSANEDAGSSSTSTEDERVLPREYFNGFLTEITHDGRNSNGCSLERARCRYPNVGGFWSSTNMRELDEAYTRRVLGFATVQDMYRWISCEELLNRIEELPMLIVNSMDDPLILEQSHAIPRAFAERCPKALFVQTQHGGHLGFYEGGVIPNRLSWLDRLFVEFSKACIKASESP